MIISSSSFTEFFKEFSATGPTSFCFKNSKITLCNSASFNSLPSPVNVLSSSSGLSSSSFVEAGSDTVCLIFSPGLGIEGEDFNGLLCVALAAI
ncbi:MAG: hypothetical protein ACQETL_08790 [Bacteroidota bacterium]